MISDHQDRVVLTENNRDIYYMYTTVASNLLLVFKSTASTVYHDGIVNLGQPPITHLIERSGY